MASQDRNEEARFPRRRPEGKYTLESNVLDSEIVTEINSPLDSEDAIEPVTTSKKRKGRTTAAISVISQDKEEVTNPSTYRKIVANSDEMSEVDGRETKRRKAKPKLNIRPLRRTGKSSA